MTIAGAEALREELQHRKSKVRSRIVQAISEAREKGDLKENAEYHAAKEQQSFNEGRIQEIENKLGAVEIIDVKSIPPSGKVIFGTTVSLLNLDDDNQVKYQIVGEDEADIKQSKISIHSPIARALIGKQVSDIAVVAAPNGDVEYEIIAIDHS
jgi:transcription elongation factor GreA